MFSIFSINFGTIKPQLFISKKYAERAIDALLLPSLKQWFLLLKQWFLFIEKKR